MTHLVPSAFIGRRCLAESMETVRRLGGREGVWPEEGGGGLDHTLDATDMTSAAVATEPASDALRTGVMTSSGGDEGGGLASAGTTGV